MLLELNAHGIPVDMAALELINIVHSESTLIYVYKHKESGAVIHHQVVFDGETTNEWYDTCNV